MDGHYSHITNTQLFKLCIESGKDTCLICLPSGQTDKLLPLDSCPLGTMKSKWTAYKSFHRINPSLGGKKKKTAHGPSPAVSVSDADIPSTIEPKSKPKKSRKRKEHPPVEPFRLPSGPCRSGCAGTSSTKDTC
ncbi:hypothetical protein RvY_03867 [Ramazzottius varieornatus]|uniref:DDE-1 domain-containing protein n=1 Tax=Ramazzottius varieornatus TaxID=947166 RepID=A0A1D1UZP2_RAMVA|nr:hypothetical protein RvY_03867 [Ramazzottius varieornatus]